MNSSGIPMLAPEIQLRYKSGSKRPKDESNLAALLSYLEPHRRECLSDLLAAHRPDHPWLAGLEDSAKS